LSDASVTARNTTSSDSTTDTSTGSTTSSNPFQKGPDRRRKSIKTASMYDTTVVEDNTVVYTTMSTSDSASDTLTASVQTAILTHTGPCGVCSSLQDLAAYATWGSLFREKAVFCGLLDDFIPEASVACLQQLGLTEDCAWLWYYHRANTDSACFDICMHYYVWGPDDRQDTCSMPDCVSCEIYSAYGILEQYGGRTLINSGLFEEVAYDCTNSVGTPTRFFEPCPQGTSPAATAAAKAEKGSSPWHNFIDEIRHTFGLDPYKPPATSTTTTTTVDSLPTTSSSSSNSGGIGSSKGGGTYGSKGGGFYGSKGSKGSFTGGSGSSDGSDP
jgi:hypothetical protein